MTLLQEQPALVRAPAPWNLKGQGYMFAVHMPEQLLSEQSFLPGSLAGSRRGHVAYVVFADYSECPAGPYHELLYIPGSFQFSDGRRSSITKIYVSTQDSVVNGRENWGIPKERCDFFTSYGADRIDHIHLRAEDGTVFADIQLQHKFFKLPMLGHWLPARLRTLSQQLDGQEFTFLPQITGHMKWASVLSWEFDSRYFPDLARGRVLAAFKITDFSMVFPAATVQAL